MKNDRTVRIYAGVELEDDVFCGPSCVFTNVINPRSQIVRHGAYMRTLVRCGATIGRYAFIAAGAVVRGDAPDYALMAGVPAVQKGWMSRHGHHLPTPDVDGLMVCPESGWRYQEVEPSIVRCLDWPEDQALTI
jgi:UDP-2-acetamido-3-amino-2,3-dideoxy-glucuronate N-acetyltransferase